MSSSNAIFIIKDEALIQTLRRDSNGQVDLTNVKNVEIFSLDHPRYTGTSAKYMYINGRILEVQLVRHQEMDTSPRCWFIGDSIDSDGSFYLCSPVDLMFLLLPYLYSACGGLNGRFVDPDQVFSSSASGSGISYLSKAISALSTDALTQMFSRICSSTTVGTTTCYMLDKDLVTAWLKAKVARTCAVLANNPNFAPMGMNKADGSACAAGAWQASDFGTRSWSPQSTHIYSLAIEFAMEYLTKSLHETLVGCYTDDQGQAMTVDSVTSAGKKKVGTVTGDRDIEKDTSVSALKRKATEDTAREKKAARPTIDPKNSLMRFFTKKVEKK